MISFSFDCVILEQQDTNGKETSEEREVKSGVTHLLKDTADCRKQIHCRLVLAGCRNVP